MCACVRQRERELGDKTGEERRGERGSHYGGPPFPEPMSPNEMESDY